MAILQLLLALSFLFKGYGGVHVSFVAANKSKACHIPLHFA